jgi:flagellar biogenesis protein FliO
MNPARHLLMLLLVAGSAAAQTNTLPPLTSAPTVSASFAVLRVIGGLGLVIALFLGGVWLFRHWQSLVTLKGRPRKLAVLEVCTLGNRQALYLIKCDRQRFLISGGTQGISLLSELPAGEVEPEPVPGEIPSRSFAEKLQRALNRS